LKIEPLKKSLHFLALQIFIFIFWRKNVSSLTKKNFKKGKKKRKKRKKKAALARSDNRLQQPSQAFF
jgi:hypothetical protein